MNAYSLSTLVRSVRGLVPALALVALAGISGCKNEPAAPAGGGESSVGGAPAAKAAPAAAPAGSAVDSGAAVAAVNKTPTITLLVTSDENGWLLPTTEEGKVRGGAAELLGRWVAEEKHCVGPIPASGVPTCTDAATVALSTGDHWGGPSISSFYGGEPTAEVMARMGYAASALGNHELDFGREQFFKNREKGGFPYLAANLKVAGPAGKGMELPAFKLIERHGVKIGVIGLSAVNAPKSSMSGLFDGLEFGGYEETLAAVVPQVWAAGADAVVVVADECPTVLEPIVAKHADWKLAVVAGGHCRQPFEKKVGETALASPGRHFEKYLRAKLAFDTTKPAQERLTGVESQVVDVIGGAGAPAPDAEAAATIGRWKAKDDAALGEEIGFTKAGIAQTAPEMVRWIAGSWREMLGTDGAILNKGGIRQGLPAGKITKGSVHSVLPFMNSLMIVKVSGADLAKNLAKPEAAFVGFTKAGKDFKDAKGAKLDPKKLYSIATADFMYFGGDGFEFEAQDPLPTETGMIWQTPVIEWTKKHPTTEAKPLEKALPQ